MTHNERQSSVRISAFLLLAIFFGLFACGIYSLAAHQEDGWMQKSKRGWLNGKLSARIEGWYDDVMILQPPATGLWGALRYGLFDTGNDGVVIGQDGWLFSKEEFSLPPDAEVLQASYIRQIQQTHALLRERGVALYVVLLPSKARVYQRHLAPMQQIPARKNMLLGQMRTALQDSGVPLIDATQALLPSTSGRQPHFFLTDTHWRPEAARRVAAYVASTITIDDSVRTRYRVTKGDVSALDGDLAKFVPLGWFAGLSSVQPELYHRYRADAEGGAALSGGLFGDANIPVTLVGTSYSAITSWHFADFLKASLQADVLNVSEEGEGPFVPMQRYLERIQDASTLPEVVIWEIPERFFHIAPERGN